VHILQGVSAYLIFDRFYLEFPDFLRETEPGIGFLYLFPNLLVGLAISIMAAYIRQGKQYADWKAGTIAGVLAWAVSSPIVIVKRQIIFKLSNWLLCEIAVDLVIFLIVGALAGFLAGRGIVEGKAKSV
jgi:hypothetical protein